VNIHDTIEALRLAAHKGPAELEHDAICSAIDLLIAMEAHDEDLAHRCRQRKRVNLCRSTAHRGRPTRCNECPQRRRIVEAE
jgi:hypothetical protein